MALASEWHGYVPGASFSSVSPAQSLARRHLAAARAAITLPVDRVPDPDCLAPPIYCLRPRRPETARQPPFLPGLCVFRQLCRGDDSLRPGQTGHAVSPALVLQNGSGFWMLVAPAYCTMFPID
ncbi:hypothetical protein VFPBJ_03216 [Purpureocillium lilacinum]|uniref:Uncharacterized protein n=1 Tax=Purpureocillium lilacinum TaxID=33203 RepID=A0A179H406_PURLI|nr:hypothetical protein VFPBJ_03216 [Purpureocillium lilacinum]